MGLERGHHRGEKPGPFIKGPIRGGETLIYNGEQKKGVKLRGKRKEMGKFLRK